MSGKNIPNIIDCHLKKGYPFLVIVGSNISASTGHQMIVQYSTRVDYTRDTKSSSRKENLEEEKRQ